MAKRVFVGWAFGLLSLACSAEGESVESARAAKRTVPSQTQLARDATLPAQLACDTAKQYGAALATFTVDCLGTIGPDSYRVVGNRLQRGFESCSLDASKLRDIDSLLSLQEREDRAPGLSQCLAQRYTTFLAQLAGSKVAACPSWRKVHTVNPITPEIIDRVALELERSFVAMPDALEEKNLYQAYFEPGFERGTMSAGTAAVACAAGFEGFVLGHEADKVLTDPYSWVLAVTFATASDDPFLRPGYYHPMSYAGPPPGAIYGHYNRFAPCPGCPPEACSYWAGAFHVRTRLQADCLDPTDINTCVSYCGPPLP
jgi:hypothetical protein